MTLAELEALQTGAARRFIGENRDADPAGLALARRGAADIPLRACVEQVDCRQKARRKLPSLSDSGFLFEPTALQQCSGEATARYKATVLTGRRLLDLTAGLGIDSLHFARSFARVDTCEANPVLSALFRVNFHTLGVANVSHHSGDAVAYLHAAAADGYDWIYIDPSRRQGDRRIVDLRYCEPDVTVLEPLLLSRAAQVCIKASPAFDISRSVSIFKALREVRVVSVDGECKELLLFLSRSPTGSGPLIKAVLISRETGGAPRVFTMASSGGQESNKALYSHEIDSYFFDPDAAIIKAGMVDHLAGILGVQKVGRGSSYLTAPFLPPSFPGRAFEVVAWMPWQRRVVADYCRQQRIGAAVLARRDFPLSPEKIRAMLGLAEGDREYLFFTRISSGEPLCVHARGVVS
jgi:hypothetical protein